MKENFIIPLNIPVSKKAIHVLRGLLEKNTKLRIELSSPLIMDWLEEENVKLNYNRQKPINVEDTENNINLSITENKNNNIDKHENTQIIANHSTINKNDKIKDNNNDQFNENDIIREFAKFEIKDEHDSKNGHKDNFGSHNNNNNHNISSNKKPLKSAKTGYGGIKTIQNKSHKDFSKIGN
jgi:hypothetical protein